MSPDNLKTLGETQRWMCARLTAAGVETPALDARLLLQHALQVDHAYLVAHPHVALVARRRVAALALLRRRLAHEPVSRITGAREFYSRSFAINRDVLDPRADTETLVDVALEAARLILPNTGTSRLLDVGTGSGAIVINLLKELPGWQAVATDVSAAALEVARRNAAAHDVLDRLDLINTCWLDEAGEGFDLIASNPPYIATPELAGLDPEVREFDPALALDGGSDGLDAYRAIVPAAHAALRSGGSLCVEIGTGQDGQVWQLFERTGFSAHRKFPTFRRDLAGHVRVVSGWKP